MNRQIRVHGKVQGVFYRKHTEEAANKIGLKGYVENHSDGTVFMQVEGDDIQLKAIEEWCHQGSPKSEVTKVEVVDGKVQSFLDFQIRY